MFTYIKFKNYKSLINTTIDLTYKKKPKNLAIIYGENGAGKSNIASGFYTLAEFSQTMMVKDLINSVIDDLNGIEKDDERAKRMLMDMIKGRHRDTEAIINSTKTVGTDENMSIEYGFEIENKRGTYYIETDNERIVREKLDFVVDKNKGYYYDIDYNNNVRKMNPRVFIDKTYLLELNDKLDKYWGKHTLFSIINNDIDNNVEDYLNDKLSEKFMDVLYLMLTFSCTFKDGIRTERGSLKTPNEILTKLDKGNIELKDENELDKAEEFLNDVFTGLYSDIKNVYYLREKKNNRIKYKLFFKKRIGNKILDIDFERESTGTMRILDILPSIYTAVNGNISIIDEFDSGIHDIMVRDILKEINRSLEGQLILTTHNTLLLEEEEFKNSIYFIVIDSDGYKEVLSINDYDNRTHPNNNIRDLYLKGLYEGIPYTGNFDFEEIKNRFK